MAPVSLGVRLAGVNGGLALLEPAIERRRAGRRLVAPDHDLGEAGVALHVHQRGSLVGGGHDGAGTASPTMNFTSSGVSMTLTGLTTAPVLAMA